MTNRRPYRRKGSEAVKPLPVCKIGSRAAGPAASLSATVGLQEQPADNREPFETPLARSPGGKEHADLFARPFLDADYPRDLEKADMHL